MKEYQPSFIDKSRIASILSAIGAKRRTMANASLSSFIEMYMQRIAERKTPQFHKEIVRIIEDMIQAPTNTPFKAPPNKDIE